MAFNKRSTPKPSTSAVYSDVSKDVSSHATCSHDEGVRTQRISGRQAVARVLLVQGFEPRRGAVLRAEVVDLRRLHVSYDLKARRRVGEVAIVEVEVLRVEAGDALRVERARVTDDAVHRV